MGAGRTSAAGAASARGVIARPWEGAEPSTLRPVNRTSGSRGAAQPARRQAVSAARGLPSAPLPSGPAPGPLGHDEQRPHWRWSLRAAPSPVWKGSSVTFSSSQWCSPDHSPRQGQRPSRLLAQLLTTLLGGRLGCLPVLLLFDWQRRASVPAQATRWRWHPAGLLLTESRSPKGVWVLLKRTF